MHKFWIQSLALLETMLRDKQTNDKHNKHSRTFKSKPLGMCRRSRKVNVWMTFFMLKCKRPLHFSLSESRETSK